VAVKIDTADVPSTANVLTRAFDVAIAQPIEIYDNTLREGEQAPGVVLSAERKLELAAALDAFGIHWANVGFPAASAEEREGVARIAKAGFRMKTAALTRMREADIDVTADTGVDLVSLFLGGSDVHLEHKLRMSEADAIRTIEKGVAQVRRRGALSSFTVEDASRTPLPRLLRLLRAAAEAGADYVVLADTVGVLTPRSAYAIVSAARESVSCPVGVHFHDDLGLALANSLAALEAGAQLVHTTVNGPGERSGNVCTLELAVLLRVKYGRDLGLRLEQAHALSRAVHVACGTDAPPHKAVTGKWCFTHESGIHVAGVLSHPETYQPYPPALVGRSHEIVFGKHSGAAGIRYLARREGIELSDEACDAVLALVKTTAEQSKQAVPDERVVEWIRSNASQRSS